MPPLQIPSHLTMPSDMSADGYPAEFIAKLQYLIEQRSNRHAAALTLISLNNLPMIISGFGHEAAEDAIKSLIQSLENMLNDNQDQKHAFISRIQKDQIAITVQDDTINSFDQKTDEISTHIRHFFHESNFGTIYILSAIASIALPDNNSAVTATEILNQAYIAVKNGDAKQTYEYEPICQESNAIDREEMSIVTYINNAIRQGKFCMAFQPIIDAKDGSTTYHEALLRVVKDDGTLSTAGPLIPVAERTGLIDIIDELVLEMVSDELVKDPELVVSFNVSNLTASSPSWLVKFKKIAARHPEIIPRMMVEITETAAHLDMSTTAYFVAALQAQGAKVALDDFGSGYTSFRQLKTLSIDIIKIDGVFIKDLLDNHDNRLFIKTMLDFTNGFGLKTVAEFVENGETAKLLMELGVDYMQGYYFGYPEVRRIIGEE